MSPQVHVLIVDDEGLIRLNLRALLEDLGFLVSEAAHGREALDLFERELPDLVLTDLRMPEMDGLELIEKLTKQHPETPVIVVSGTGSIRDAMEAVRRGAWDYITKPVSVQDTVEIVINRTLERSRLMRENRRYHEHLEELVCERTRELHDSENRYRRLLESVTSYVFTTTFSGGKPVRTVHHHGCEALTGFAPEEYDVDPDLWLRMVYEEDRPLVLDMAQRIPDAIDPIRFDHRLVTKNGSVRWVQNTLVPHRDTQGRLLAYDGIIADITERRQAEDSLRKLSRAVEQSPVSIVITDTRGTIEFVNPKFTQITGYEREEALGENPRILKTGHTSPEEYQRLWTTISTGKVWEGEFQNRKKNGDCFWEHATISPLRNREGGITNYLAIKEDITEKKRLEEQLRHSQKMEAIGLLAGGVAHDFNNILTVIMGYGNMLLMNMKPDNPMAEMIDQILRSAERAAHLTSSLLAFGHKQAMNPQICDLNDIVTKIQKFLVRVIGEDIQLKINLGDDHLTIFADSGQIEQILINLATNARDAIPKGGLLSIETSLQEVDESFVQAHGHGEPGRYALVAVSDTGCGMDEATRNRVFEPFFTTKGMGKGTGLGMAIVYGIVKQHNGYIHVYSEPGKGSTFKVFIPLVEPGHMAHDKVVDAEPPKMGTETILVVEDEPEVRQLIKQILNRFGYGVILAENGQEAVEKYRMYREEIKLVLMDVIMPVMNGREASEQIKKIQPDVKLLFTSGYTADIVQSRGEFKAGVELIMKPIQPVELVGKIREILDRQ
jgi:PAS domain S-box-containing protein